MTGLIAKINSHSKKVVVFCILFLAIFAGIFYLVNLDTSKIENQSAPANNTAISNPAASNLSEEFKKKLGSTMFFMENYDNWAKRYELSGSENGLDLDPDKDELPNYLEYIHGTNPLKDDTDGDTYADKLEIVNGYDPDAPGDTKPIFEIFISKIKVDVPMNWSRNENELDMLRDLEDGVSHFYKTSAPGQNGNAIVFGHSSNYIWAKGNYNHIFKDLNDLEKGDSIKIKVIQKNGRNILYHYIVKDKFISAPDDERIFAKTENPSLTLSTCWPLGTTFRRLIVKAELL